MIHPIVNFGKTYSKIYDEKEFKSFNDWMHAVDRIERRLQFGIFKDPKGKYYTAKFKKIDLSVIEEDEVMNMTITIQRIVKFKWKYVKLKVKSKK